MIEKILIGSINYVVEETSELRNDDDKRLLGNIDYDRQVIHLVDYMPQDKKREVLLHEVVHGILEHYCVEEQVEFDVDLISKGLAAVLVHNPEFTKLFL
jgi:hypothetical protein